MTEFLFFRHGETDWNKAGRLQGSTDIQLNSEGLRQAQALAEFMRELRETQALTHPKRDFLKSLISSPLARAQMTARIAFGLTPDAPLRLDPRLAETKMGKVEGLTRDEILAQYGQEVWNTWASPHESSWAARFPGGESKGEVRDRSLGLLKELMQEGDFWVLSTHGGLLRRLLAHWNPAHTEAVPVHNGSVFRVIFEDLKPNEPEYRVIAPVHPIFKAHDR